MLRLTPVSSCLLSFPGPAGNDHTVTVAAQSGCVVTAERFASSLPSLAICGAARLAIGDVDDDTVGAFAARKVPSRVIAAECILCVWTTISFLPLAGNGHH